MREVHVRLLNKDPDRDVRAAALNTVNKPFVEAEMAEDMRFKYLISEHSPIRRLRVEIKLIGICQFTSVHFRTHGTFQEHFVSTGRPDRVKKERSITDTKNHIIDTNPKALIDMMRQRLCFKSSPDTYLWAGEIRSALINSEEPWLNVLGKCLVPNCLYRGGCPEFVCCGQSEDSILERYQNGGI